MQRDQFNPKAAMLPDQVFNLDAAMKDAIDLKFLEVPLSKEQLAECFQIRQRGRDARHFFRRVRLQRLLLNTRAPAALA